MVARGSWSLAALEKAQDFPLQHPCHSLRSPLIGRPGLLPIPHRTAWLTAPPGCLEIKGEGGLPRGREGRKESDVGGQNAGPRSSVSCSPPPPSPHRLGCGVRRPEFCVGFATRTLHIVTSRTLTLLTRRMQSLTTQVEIKWGNAWEREPAEQLGKSLLASSLALMSGVTSQLKSLQWLPTA